MDYYMKMTLKLGNIWVTNLILQDIRHVFIQSHFKM